MDAAVLLEAGWTDMVHEVWVTVIPDEEVMCFCLLVKDVRGGNSFYTALEADKTEASTYQNIWMWVLLLHSTTRWRQSCIF